MDIWKEIHQAIERGQFVPYFQPLVDLRTGKIDGFEILARWLHPSRGVVLPQDFISQVERLGVMNGLTTSMLAHAFAAARTVPDVIGFSVNISPVQLHDRTLASLIGRLADEQGFDLSRLTAEITESALVDDLDRARSVVGDLKSLGIRLSLDDFGTGYSSLLHLQSLPFDEIKVDASFVRSMTADRQSRKITAAVVSLGHSLGLRTVAEGIEERAQAELLIWHGCNLGQGWLYGRPAPADQLPAIVAQGVAGTAAHGQVPSHVASLALALDGHPADRLAQLRAIYNATPVGLAFLDRELRYVSINERLAALNGHPVELHLGRTVAEIHPQAFPLWEPNLRRALSGEAVLDVELTRPSPAGDGSILSTLASYQPAFDETGEVVGVSISVADITAIRQRDAALRASEAEYHRTMELKSQALARSEAMLTAVIEAAPVGIVIAEAQGEIILSANLHARAILGVDLKPGQVWAESSWEAFDEFDQPIALRSLPLSLAIRTGESSAAVGVRLRRADSSIVWISLTAAPIRAEDGTILGGVLAIQDINGARQKNQQIIDLVSQLSAIASSDIYGNPLAL